MAKSKCACKACSCMVEEKSAVKKGGKLFCSASCADGHKTQKGCGHKGCTC